MKKRTGRAFTDALGKDVGIRTFESFLLQADAGGELFIKGCKKLSVCSDTKIGLQCEGRDVTVEGQDLTLHAFSREQTLIGGRIAAIGFSEGGE